MEETQDQAIPPHDKKPISDNMNNEVEDGTGPRPPPMLIARSNLLARPFGNGSETVLPNFKKFKKKVSALNFRQLLSHNLLQSRSLVSVEDVQDSVSTHVIKCVLEETKPTEGLTTHAAYFLTHSLPPAGPEITSEMDAWLKDGAAAEKEKCVLRKPVCIFE